MFWWWWITANIWATIYHYNHTELQKYKKRKKKNKKATNIIMVWWRWITANIWATSPPLQPTLCSVPGTKHIFLRQQNNVSAKFGKRPEIEKKWVKKGKYEAWEMDSSFPGWLDIRCMGWIWMNINQSGLHRLNTSGNLENPIYSHCGWASCAIHKYSQNWKKKQTNKTNATLNLV